ncbi:ATP-dependent helicase, partial [Ureaplasma urealyticum]
KKENVIGIAPTGTGKTLAFALPILNNLDLSQKLQAIIIAPTRELVRQIFSKIALFKKQQPLLQIKMLIGGESIDKQINSQLNKN